MQASKGSLLKVQVAVPPAAVLHTILHKAVAKVLTTQARVTCHSLHLKDSILDRQERHIACSSAQVKHKHVLLLRTPVQAVRDCRGCWLINDSQHVQA
mmetsp:Transcript_79712/g.185080  ORF Transcript_79712/g.185080 Transcript_79712/m.185080 type:complete len:98 (+) Transcript_79712:1372-1665(+)